MRSALIIVLLITIGLLGGCRTEKNGGEEETKAPETTEHHDDDAEHHDDAAEHHDDEPAEHHDESADDEADEHEHGTAGHADATAQSKALPAGANTMCPVLPEEKAIADLFVEYKGKRIYLCCKKCQGRVSRDPAAWYAKVYGKK